MKSKFLRFGALASAAAGVLTMASPAMATAPTGTTGYDELPNVVLVGGSDTSYYVSTLLGRAYNTSPGCSTNNTVAPYDACVVGQTPPAGYANWDHDVMVDTFPYGSGSGRNALADATLTLNDIDLGRSSSGLSSTAPVNTMYEFASEGLAVIAVNPSIKGRTTATLSFTQAQLQAIYEDGNNVCDSTVTWGQLGDTGTNAADLVQPFGMNSGSGTFGSFNTYVGGTANTGDCVLGQPFENDVAELGKANSVATAADMIARRDSGNGIWWMSGAVLNKFPVLSNGMSPIAFNSGTALVSYTATTGYPLRRNVSYIARDTDAGFAAGAMTFAAGNDFGKAGAVREYLRWVCRTTPHAADPNTQNTPVPVSYLQVISGAIQNSGFSTTVGTGTAGSVAFGRCRATT